MDNPKTIKELETEIYAKIDIIRDNVMTGKGTDHMVLNEHLLASVSDDLSEVLVNWDDDIIGGSHLLLTNNY
jgi:hypothetical protein